MRESRPKQALRYAAQVTILATSRQPMNVPGEHCCPVPPLPVPEPGAQPVQCQPVQCQPVQCQPGQCLRGGASRGGASRRRRPGAVPGGYGDAVELFAQRAAAASPGFAVTPANRREVILLCGRLDGIPLAIELAAVQLRTLTLFGAGQPVEHRFGLLACSATAGPCRTSRRCAPPRNGATTSARRRSSCSGAAVGVRRVVRLAAAEALCAGGPLAREDILPTLIGLVDKSVVLRTEEDAARYWLLGTIREFGAERLARLPADADVTQDQHIAYFRVLAGAFSRHAKDDDQLQRYHLLRREHPDLRAALGYALAWPRRGSGQAGRRPAPLLGDLRPAAGGEALADQDPAPVPRAVTGTGLAADDPWRPEHPAG